MPKSRDRSSIAVHPNQKRIVEETKEMLEDTLGVEPTRGETIRIACEHLLSRGYSVDHLSTTADEIEAESEKEIEAEGGSTE